MSQNTISIESDFNRFKSRVFLRNETTLNFQRGFDIFDDLLKKSINNNMFYYYIGSLYLILILKKLNFVKLLRKTK